MSDEQTSREDEQAEPVVLIVEDEPASRRALSMLLRASGYSTCATASAEEAIRLVRGNDVVPDAALVDVDLPGMDGLELVRRLERDYPQLVPILVTAGDTWRIHQFCRDHAVRYVPKPLNIDTILGILGSTGVRH